jgi:DNA-binding GntR family transcriptional regulator
MRLTVEERVYILESYLKTISYAHCTQRFFEKFRRQLKMNITRTIKEINERTQIKVARNMSINAMK